MWTICPRQSLAIQSINLSVYENVYCSGGLMVWTFIELTFTTSATLITCSIRETNTTLVGS